MGRKRRTAEKIDPHLQKISMMKTHCSNFQIVLGLASALIFSPVTAGPPLSEADIETCLCRGMQTQQSLEHGGRVDCVDRSRAIEIEPTDRWAESIGQVLHYSAETGLEGHIFMYCKDTKLNCAKDLNRLERTIQAHSLPISIRFFSNQTLTEACALP